MARKHIIRKQRQRRRAGDVKRVEIVLSADTQRDHDIHDFLATLPRGAAGEFIRQAIHEKIERERGQQAPQRPAPAQSEASAQFEALMQELAAQRREIAELRDAVAAPVMVAAGVPNETPETDRRRRMQPEARSAPGPAVAATDPSASGEIQSRGIDMSRPRRRRSAPPAAAPKADQQPPELDERAQAALARELIRSIGAFGQEK